MLVRKIYTAGIDYNVHMPYMVEYLEEYDAVKIVGKGILTTIEFKEGSMECVKKIKETGATRLMVDNRELQNKPTVAEIYDLPKYFKEIGLELDIPISILVSQEYKDLNDLKFFETVCINNGFICRIFFNTTDMINWWNMVKS